MWRYKAVTSYVCCQLLSQEKARVCEIVILKSCNRDHFLMWKIKHLPGRGSSHKQSKQHILIAFASPQDNKVKCTVVWQPRSSITVSDLYIPNKEWACCFQYVGQPSSTEGITSTVSVIFAWDCYSCYFFLIQDSIKVLALKRQSRELEHKEVKVMEEAVGIQKRKEGWRSQENVSQLSFFISTGRLFT